MICIRFQQQLGCSLWGPIAIHNVQKCMTVDQSRKVGHDHQGVCWGLRKCDRRREKSFTERPSVGRAQVIAEYLQGGRNNGCNWLFLDDNGRFFFCKESKFHCDVWSLAWLRTVLIIIVTVLFFLSFFSINNYRKHWTEKEEETTKIHKTPHM